MVREETLLLTGEHDPSYRFLSRIATARERLFSVQVRILRGILEQGAREGVFSAPDVAKATRIVGYVVRGFSTSTTPSGEAPARDADPGVEAAALYQILCNGLTVRQRKA